MAQSSGCLHLCSVQEVMQVMVGVWAQPPFFRWGYLMAPQGSGDIFTVYLIEEFAERMFLALHE